MSSICLWQSEAMSKEHTNSSLCSQARKTPHPGFLNVPFHVWFTDRSLFRFLGLSGIIGASGLLIIKLRKWNFHLPDSSLSPELGATWQVSVTGQVYRQLELSRDLSLYLGPQPLCPLRTTAFSLNKAPCCASCPKRRKSRIIWLVNGYQWLYVSQPEGSPLRGEWHCFPHYTCHLWQRSPESHTALTPLGLLWWWDMVFSTTSKQNRFDL